MDNDESLLDTKANVHIQSPRKKISIVDIAPYLIKIF